MPWCPECKCEYVPGIESCADCGSLLVEDDPRPVPEQEQQKVQDPEPTTSSGLIAGCLGAILSWVALFVLAPLSALGSGDGLNPLDYLRLFICSTIGFLLGIAFRARFVSSLIGWLLVSTPFLSAVGLGYAHEEPPVPIPIANLIWLAIFLPILLGPISIAAGSNYTRNRRASLALWLIPTGLSVMAVYVASRMVGLGK